MRRNLYAVLLGAAMVGCTSTGDTDTTGVSPRANYPLTTCVVSGEPLDAMGEPIAVEVQGQTVYLCCEGCRAKLEASQDEYLQKIDDAKAAAERAESEVRGSANETIDSLEEAARDATN